jgi:hypothetical protein
METWVIFTIDVMSIFHENLPEKFFMNVSSVAKPEPARSRIILVELEHPCDAAPAPTTSVPNLVCNIDGLSKMLQTVTLLYFSI